MSYFIKIRWDGEMDRQRGRRTDRGGNGQTEEETDGQRGRRTDRQTHNEVTC